jgi:hypothetical protein
MPVIPALRRQRQKDFKFKVSLGFIVRTSPQKIKKERKRERKLFEMMIPE